jgi:hypothetical protein
MPYEITEIDVIICIHLFSGSIHCTFLCNDNKTDLVSILVKVLPWVNSSRRQSSYSTYKIFKMDDQCETSNYICQLVMLSIYECLGNKY